MDRRTFLKLAGAGSAVVAAASVPVAALSLNQSGRLTFKATAGLPAKPLPAYATNVLEGNLDLGRGTGVITSQVFAGHSEGVSDIALPGMSRLIRVTGIVKTGGTTRVSGIIDDRSVLSKGEKAQVEILIDHVKGVVTAPFAGHQVTLNLAG